KVHGAGTINRMDRITSWRARRPPRKSNRLSAIGGMGIPSGTHFSRMFFVLSKALHYKIVGAGLILSPQASGMRGQIIQ
ncbi:MAG: hypothetical protein ACOC0S_04940, partial [Desulfohalobiaceae bacterium]